MNKAPISVVMLTLNEQHHLPGVLENLEGWAQRIFIVDSLSADRTIDIAHQYDVSVVQRPFTNFGDQWNWALKNLPLNSEWTIKIDPDERLSDELKKQIESVIRQEASCDGYNFPRRLWFMGRPLHVKQDVLRLWKTGRCRFSDTLVNEQPIISGEIGRLTGTMEHLDSVDLLHWYEKQNRYTTMEAMMRYRGDGLAALPSLWGNALERRMFFKKWLWKLPFRYQLLYGYHLFGKGVWRDGKVGRAWARLRTEVYRMRELKYIEMQNKGFAPDIPKANHGSFDPRVLQSSLQKALFSDDGDVMQAQVGSSGIPVCSD